MDEQFSKWINEMLLNTLGHAKKSCYDDNGLPDAYSIGLYNGIELVRSFLLKERPKYFEIKEENKNAGSC